MFTYSPSVRRTADQSAVEDLENPFLVVDPDERIVDCNPAAEALFDVAEPAVLGEPLESATGLTIDDGETTVRTHGDRGDRRELAVSTSPPETSRDGSWDTPLSCRISPTSGDANSASRS